MNAQWAALSVPPYQPSPDPSFMDQDLGIPKEKGRCIRRPFCRQDRDDLEVITVIGRCHFLNVHRDGGERGDFPLTFRIPLESDGSAGGSTTGTREDLILTGLELGHVFT